MKRSTRALAVVALAMAASMAVGTSGLSAMNADRDVSAAAVEDSEAYLGLEIDVEEGDDGGGPRAISFVGFCGDDSFRPNASAVVTKYKTEAEDPATEALAVDWNTDVPVSTVVLKTGGGSSGPDAIENFAGGTDRTAEVGEGTSGNSNQTASEFCPGNEVELSKLEAGEGDLTVADDATPVGDEAAVSVTVTNQFTGETVIDVEVTIPEVGSTKTVEGLETGETETVTLDVDCEEVDGEVTVDVLATGSDVKVDLERSRTVC